MVENFRDRGVFKNVNKQNWMRSFPLRKIDFGSYMGRELIRGEDSGFRYRSFSISSSSGEF